MSHPREYIDGKPPPEVRVLRPYVAGKRRGPATTLTEEMITAIAAALGEGATKRDASTRAGTNEACLQRWLRVGRDAIERRKRSIYTRLVTEVDAAEAHYRAELTERLHECIRDRHMNDRPIRWRLAQSDPKAYAVQREGGGAVGGAALGPAFELVTPEQALAALEDKLSLFLAEEAPAPEPPPEGASNGS